MRLGWLMSDEHRHFICAVCKLEFVSDPSVTHEERVLEYQLTHEKEFPGEEHVSQVCQDCYPKVMAFARERGLIP